MYVLWLSSMYYIVFKARRLKLEFYVHHTSGWLAVLPPPCHAFVIGQNIVDFLEVARSN